MRKAAMMFAAIWLMLTLTASAQVNDDTISRVRRIVEEVRAASYPELKTAEIEINLFDSPSDYFQTRFTFTSYLFRNRLRYVLRVNRKLFSAGTPEDGVRAILAHELGHIVYYRTRNRLALLGLTRLACRDFAARFERGTDLEAIARGYGEGLKSYRLWL
ncbi:MAG TPA: M48 family metalloprotease, partial [Blastocatellia bacterium]|nr:M48 family metalloprotease [Blastocatellia bacterium]